MQISNLPKLLPVPFASNGSKQDIPVASQIGVSGGRASYTDGFPPLTRTPIAAGGIPPFGTDFNGVLNDITSAIRWAQAGGGYGYDSTFSSGVSGYPIGARLANSTGDGYWLNTVDGNTNNPEASAPTPLTGWVPVESYGVTTITGLGGSSVTLSTLQASKDRIILTGNLTSNINLTLPAWIKSWTVINNCSGAFSVTVKTQNGTGVVIPAGSSSVIQGDGTNITATLGTAAFKNIGNSANQIPDMSFFTLSMGQTGYQKLPSGMIIQWGIIALGNDGNAFATLPLTFPNSIHGGVAGEAAPTGWSANSCVVAAFDLAQSSRTGVTVRARSIVGTGGPTTSTATFSVRYFCWGY
ncbi:gp53-like domain-containing protein [Atlantibacter hermannii]|uniref:gp53-like domain-containing protein n=1 Tax=Atlantibacter hermannii TaxID=565 RepID=UPI0013EF40FB|nr:hypothetical protein [Atlantibacter hermannii]